MQFGLTYHRILLPPPMAPANCWQQYIRHLVVSINQLIHRLGSIEEFSELKVQLTGLRKAIDLEFSPCQDLAPVTLNPIKILHNHHNYINFLCSLPVIAEERIALQGGALGDDNPGEIEMVVLVAASGPYPLTEVLAGESISSCRALMQKPSYIKTSGNSMRETYPRYGPMPVDDSDQCSPLSSTLFSWAGWYKSMFVGVAASTRIKIFPKESMWLGASGIIQGSEELNELANYVQTDVPMTYTGPHKGAEFTIPYYGRRKYVLGRASTTTRPNIDMRIQLQVRLASSGDSLENVRYMAMGPDIRVNGFRFTPRMLSRPQEDITLPWYDTVF